LTGGAALIPIGIAGVGAGVGVGVVAAVGVGAATHAYSANDVRLVYHCLPFKSIRPGYRVMELRNVNTGRTLPMCDLLCKFEFSESS
jgi:hypothetical protein